MRLRLNKDSLNAVRRRLRQQFDQVWAWSWKTLAPHRMAEPFTPPCRFSLITVNFSTTHYLKLMLVTLCEQTALQSLTNIVIIDNGSRDGGLEFLTQVSSRIDRIHLVKNRLNTTHARGLRLGINHLCRMDAKGDDAGNALLICDADIVFRNPNTLKELAALLEQGAAFIGELRHGIYPYPEAQASFFAMRRSVYHRDDIAPIVDHGAPAYFMQRSIRRAGLEIVDFPSNHGEYILHRGRSGVSAASEFYPLNPYATTTNNQPHFMGVPSGDLIWEEIEKKYEILTRSENETALIEHLAKALSSSKE